MDTYYSKPKHNSGGDVGIRTDSKRLDVLLDLLKRSGLDAPRMTVELLGIFVTHASARALTVVLSSMGTRRLFQSFLPFSACDSIALVCTRLHPSFYATYTALMYGHRYIST